MPELDRAGRRLRLVDVEEPVSPDPFARPACQPVPHHDDHDTGAPVRRGLAQSARADYSIKWTETGLAGSPPPGSDGDWPSDRWRSHLADCGPAPRCTHVVPDPEWWVLMAGRGLPLHPDAEQARQMAHAVINTWQTTPRMPDDLTTMARDIVRDALVIAPQPVAKSWVNSTLSTVGRLVASVALDSGPLTREHVLSERARERYLSVHCANHSERSVEVYRGRLNKVVQALNGLTIPDPKTGQQPMPKNEPLTPHTVEEERALYVWANGLRTEQRRKRMIAVIVAGLGLGLDSPELIALRSDDCRIDDHGVHVTIATRDGDQRVVTCRRDWEEPFKALLAYTPPGHYLVAPWRTTPITDSTYSVTVWNAQEKSTPPVYFCTRSLRNTWLVRMMESGVPVPTLLKAANLHSERSMFRLLPYCTPQDDIEMAASLRGPARKPAQVPDGGVES